MGIKHVRGETISIGDMFSVTDVLPALAQYMVFIAVLGLVTGLLSVVPFGNILSVIIQIAVGGLLVFAVPLIVDQRLSAVEALTRSFNAAKSQFVMIVLFLIVASLAGVVGAIACGIGAIFTFPIAILSICILYRDFFLQNMSPAYSAPGYGTYPPAQSPPPGESGTPMPPRQG